MLLVKLQFFVEKFLCIEGELEDKYSIFKTVSGNRMFCIYLQEKLPIYQEVITVFTKLLPNEAAFFKNLRGEVEEGSVRC